MPLIPKVKTRELDDRYDMEVGGKKLYIYFIDKYYTIQLLGDILVGIFFVTGSIINLTDAPAIWGNVAYLIGSVSLTIRPIIKVIRNSVIYNTKKKEKDSR